MILTQVGLPREQIRMATEAALIPVWFLAVYLLVTGCTPLTYWRQFAWDTITCRRIPPRRPLTHFFRAMRKNDPLPQGERGQVVDAVDRLRDIGRPGKVEGSRELSVRNAPYLIVYKVLANAIEILAVFSYGSESVIGR